MSLRCGILGLPNVGKSTLFNSISTGKAEAANFPFCTIEPNLGVVTVPDSRVDELTKLVKPEKTIATTINFVDIAGLVKGASKGEGLGNKFLSNLREVDLLIHVVRCFENDNIVHVNSSGNPGLSTAGTGDILAGMIGGFIAQGLNCNDASKLAVYFQCP